MYETALPGNLGLVGAVANADLAFGTGIVLTAVANSQLAIAGGVTDGFKVGDIVESVPAGAGPGRITFINNSGMLISPGDSNWAAGQGIKTSPTSYFQIPGSPFTVSASPFTTINLPIPSLPSDKTFYARVKYSTTTPSALDSDFSGWSSFKTAATYSSTVGQAYGGGYFGGQINAGGIIYNLIVSPELGDTAGPNPAGSLQGQYGGSTAAGIQWKLSNTGPDASATSVIFGGTATATYGASFSYPAFYWCVSDSTGPNAGVYDTTNATGTGISGYNDWYIPAKNELEILYYNLKPTTTSNTTASGINPDAIPARASNYTAGNPAQTTASLFQGTNAQAFSTPNDYLSATEGSSSQAWGQSFDHGGQGVNNKNSNGAWARAIRRVQA